MHETSVSALADVLRHQADRIAKLVIAQELRIQLLERQVLAAHDTITDLRTRLAEAHAMLAIPPVCAPSETGWNMRVPLDTVIDNGGEGGATGQFLKLHAEMERDT